MNKLKILICLGCLLCLMSGGSTRADCGDVNCTGGSPDIADLAVLINYLNGKFGPLCDPDLADIDGLPGVTNNDLAVLIEYLYDRRLPLEHDCPPPGDTVPPVYDDSLFFRTAAVLPGRTEGKVEIWAKNVSPLISRAYSFHFSCPSSDITLDSVFVERANCLMDERVLSDWQERSLVYLMDFIHAQTYPPGETRIAVLYFTLGSEDYLREIQIDTVYSDVGQGLIYTGLGDNQLYGFKPVVVFDHCCWGMTGNANCSIAEDPDIGDITRLIDYLFISRTPLCCEEEGNTTGETGTPPDISDVMAIIDYLYLSRTPLRQCP